ncbi:MAG: hypothetical protein Q9178_007184 [Gyalolechia marmorata]
MARDQAKSIIEINLKQPPVPKSQGEAFWGSGLEASSNNKPFGKAYVYKQHDSLTSSPYPRTIIFGKCKHLSHLQQVTSPSGDNARKPSTNHPRPFENGNEDKENEKLDIPHLESKSSLLRSDCEPRWRVTSARAALTRSSTGSRLESGEKSTSSKTARSEKILRGASPQKSWDKVIGYGSTTPESRFEQCTLLLISSRGRSPLPFAASNRSQAFRHLAISCHGKSKALNTGIPTMQLSLNMREFEDDNTPKNVRDLCRTLLETEQTVPQDSLFLDDMFKKNCRKVQDRNETIFIRDIGLLIVPSTQTLATYGATHLNHLYETTNEGWNSVFSFPLHKTRPQPDFSVGFGRSAFTQEQLNKLKPFVGEPGSKVTTYFMAPTRIYFPFLTCEVKCGAAALDIADRVECAQHDRRRKSSWRTFQVGEARERAGLGDPRLFHLARSQVRENLRPLPLDRRRHDYLLSPSNPRVQLHGIGWQGGMDSL